MIKSMTGFGRSQYSDGKRSITCEIRSVNHRYCDVSVKMPRRYAFAEEAIKKVIKDKVARGKLDVSIVVDDLADPDVTIRLNEPVVQQYLDNIEVLRSQYGIDSPVDLGTILQLPEVIKQIPDVQDQETVAESMAAAAEEAVKELESMKAVEGEKLAGDLLMRGKLIKDLVEQIEERSKEVPKAYAEKIRDRIRELLDGNVEIPEDRIMMEAAIFADKSNITEELIRLKSHMDQLETIIGESTGSDGKKLDFLVQEMNREANTIGSKANDIGITELMLKIKAEVEKIREQVQNIQ